MALQMVWLFDDLLDCVVELVGKTHLVFRRPHDIISDGNNMPSIIVASYKESDSEQDIQHIPQSCDIKLALVTCR